MENRITIGRCKDCKWRDRHSECCTHNAKIHEDDSSLRGPTNDHLVYSYYESGSFYVGPDFGCVHWTKRGD